MSIQVILDQGSFDTPGPVTVRLNPVSAAKGDPFCAIPFGPLHLNVDDPAECRRYAAAFEDAARLLERARAEYEARGDLTGGEAQS